jgi:hypothetical protein
LLSKDKFSTNKLFFADWQSSVLNKRYLELKAIDFWNERMSNQKNSLENKSYYGGIYIFLLHQRLLKNNEGKQTPENGDAT